MPNFAAIHSSPLTKTLAASLADADGIKTLIATALTKQTYTTFNGAVTGSIRATQGVGMSVSVTTTADATTYNVTDPIVFTGTYRGFPQREEVLLTDTNGNQKVEGKKPFDTITSIEVPPQITTNGEFTFGVEDVCCDGERECIRRIYVGANPGNLSLLYQGVPGITNPSDLFVVIANSQHDVAPRAVDGSTTTCWPITICY